MRSRSRTVRLPFIVDDMMQEICKKEEYSNMSNCILAGCILLIRHERDMIRIHQIANANPKIQDFVLEKMFGFPMDLKEMIAMLRTISKK